ncbi:uncharacterized protein LOC111683517 isoform X2 [Lucilia cuprina]|uniref:uncharacterized protein LOC111683517 isoform X2 n=1 Tax=Lucilia cuprina TaxID=7375 RepID=UPI001F0621D6|nr:uncharacterized protein LOC111683517 isoform X2 [Lucilia cuprina]
MGLLLNWALLATAVLAGILYTQAEEQTSWSGSWSVAAQDSMLTKRSADADAEPKQGEEDVQGRNYAVHEPIYSNDTDINQIIDQIINSRREGRILNEYDRVYEDGNVDQALMQGNDMQARNLVRDKLCALGLMSCEEAKRPYYSSIYAQGPPKYGGGPYGAPKPMPPPSYFNGRPHMGPPPSSVNSFGPPRKVGYESSYKPGYRPSGPGPNYNGPYLESPPPSAIDGSSSSASFSRPPPGAVIYGSKPPGPIYTGHGPSPPYAFENPEKIQVAGSQQTNFYSHQSSASAASSSTKVVVAGGIPTGAAVASNSASSASSLQQHVHHHYHHVEGAEGAKVPSVAIPVGSGQTINTDFSALAQSSTAYTPETQGSFQTNSAFNAGFNGASQGGLLSQGASSFGQGSSSFGQGGSSFGQVGSSFGQGLNGFKPNGDLYSKPSAGLASFGGISSSSSSSGFGQSGFGQSGYGQASTPGSSYHSQNPDYYKKELHNIGGITASASNNFNSLTSGYGNEQFNGAYDTARNQFVDCQCVPFNQCPAADRIGRKEDLILPIDPRNLGKDIEALSDDAAANITVSATAEKKSDEHKSEDDKTEDKKRSKRQAIQEEENKPEDAASDLTQDSQGRLGLPVLQAIELIRRKILPTYGVSFGLPYPNNPGGYPTNVLGEHYPAQNPHFGALGPNGLNLGLINVNPLVSVQVKKTEFGENVVKPLVNLHITPSATIFDAVGNLFKSKPNVVHNSHYHHHEHYSGFDHDDHLSHHDGPTFSSPGPIHHFPSTGPSFHKYEIEMIPSKPIFEYHSGPQIYTEPSSIHHYENHHKEHYEHVSSHSTPFVHTSPGHSSFGDHSSYPTATTGFDSNSHSYPPSGGDYEHTSSHYPTGSASVGSSLHSYQPSVNEFTHTSSHYPTEGPNFGPSPLTYPTPGNEFGQGYSTDFGTSGYDGNQGFENPYDRSAQVNQSLTFSESQRYRKGKELGYTNTDLTHPIPTQAPGAAEGSDYITFPRDRKRRSLEEHEETVEKRSSVLAETVKLQERAYYGNRPVQKTCRVNEVCCRRPLRPAQPPQQQLGRCGVRNAAGITGRIKNPVYVDGDSEFGEYPWHVAILKKDPKESIYACGGTLIDAQHVITAAHCIKSQNGFDLRARLGEWDVNHDVEFFPYIERDVVSVQIHPEYYAGTLDNDLAVLKLDHPVDFTKNPHISPACLPDKFSDFTGARCWTTGWGKDAFGDQGKYQNILKEVDVPILSHHQCENQLRQTRLGYSFKLNPGFVCAGGEEGKDACKGDGGGPLVCERGGVWNVVGVVSWGIGCGQVNVPGVYVKVSHYLDWIRQITQYYK